MLPAFTVFMIDILGRIAQGDLTHYNRGIYNFLSHTPLYWTPVLFTWIIAFPAIAIILEIIPDSCAYSLAFSSLDFPRSIIRKIITGEAKNFNHALEHTPIIKLRFPKPFRKSPGLYTAQLKECLRTAGLKRPEKKTEENIIRLLNLEGKISR